MRIAVTVQSVNFTHVSVVLLLLLIPSYYHDILKLIY